MAVPSPFAPPRRENYHLFILDPSRERLLAESAARSWMSPVAHTRSDADGWTAITTRLAWLGLTARPIHVAYVTEDRIDADGRGALRHYYVLMIADALPARKGTAWIPLDDVLHGGRAMRVVQQQALNLCLSRVHQERAPFDSPAQVEAVYVWVHGCVRARGHTITGPPVPERLGRFETVLTFPTSGGPVRFKGHLHRARRDMRLVDLLHTLRPGHFPQLLAQDAERGWSLTSTARAHLAPDWSGKAPFDAMTLLAETQRDAFADPAACELMSVKTFGEDEMRETMARVRVMLGQGPNQSLWSRAAIAKMQKQADKWIRRLLSHGMPFTWTPFGYVTPHLHVTTGASGNGSRADVGFDDGDECYLAPATLAYARLLADLRQHSELSQTTRVLLEQRYVTAWTATVPAPQLTRALADSHVPAMIFAFATELERYARLDGPEFLDGPTPDGPTHPALLEHAHLLAGSIPQRMPRQSKARTSFVILPGTFHHQRF